MTAREPTLAGAISLATGFLALAGAVAYAIMRYSYQRFYNEFGLTPDDVGPSSAAALTQSGAGVALFVALFAVLPVLLALTASTGCRRPLRKALAGRGRPLAGVSWRPPLLVAISVLAALVVYRLFTRETAGHREWEQLTALAIGVLLLEGRHCAGEIDAIDAQLERDRSAAKARDEDPPPPAAAGRGERVVRAALRSTRRLPGSRLIVAGLLAVVGAFVLYASVPGDARATALCAITHPGRPVRFVHTHRTLPWLPHMAVIRVRADPATLSPSDGRPGASLPKPPLVYLGDAGGRVFVFSRTECRTVQLPESAVAVSTRPSDGHCHWWNYPKVRKSPCTGAAAPEP